MNWFNSPAIKKDNTILVASGINIFFSTLFLILCLLGYYQYQQMKGALNANSFIYMAAFQLIILTGLVLIFMGNRVGLYIYLIGQVISYIYPIATDTIDTVWGILILPIVISPIVFGYIFIKRLKYLH